MRKRPIQKNIDDFIDSAATTKELSKNTYESNDYFRNWPAEKNINYSVPALTTGSNLRKAISMSTTEKEWNAIDNHVKFLGVSKMEWLRYAIFKTMNEEIKYFNK